MQMAMKCHLSATRIHLTLLLLIVTIQPIFVAAMPDNTSSGRNPLIVRLHLVRHGETEANKANYVLGQRESPLTGKGINQAASLGSFIGRQPFWRAYSSDYDRTAKTARLILSGGGAGGGGSESLCSTTGTTSSLQQHENEVEQEQTATATDTASKTVATPVLDASSPTTESVTPDRRLRERAKGVREGRLKTITFEEAVKLHRLENGRDSDLPLLESDDDVWGRVKDWIDDVVGDACKDAMAGKRSGGDVKTYNELVESTQGQMPSSISDAMGNEYERKSMSDELGVAVDPRAGLYRRSIFDVLVVSHSATIRTAVNRLVGDQLPSNIVRGSGGSDGATKGMLVVPNTSRTIVDIVVDDATTDAGEGGTESQVVRGPQSVPLWRAKLVELTNTDHLKSIDE